MSTAVYMPVRPRDAGRTKAAILAAAKSLFSTVGYSQAGVRDIAGLAGVNSTLVRRYFGSKERLFSAALEDMLDIDALIAGPRERFGERLTRFFLDETRTQASPLPMMILAIADPAARETTVKLVERCVIGPLADWLEAEHGEIAAAQISMLCSGFYTYWKLLPLNALSPSVPTAIRVWLAATLQSVVDQAQRGAAV